MDRKIASNSLKILQQNGRSSKCDKKERWQGKSAGQ
jgi:hypothetical protein